MNITKHNVLRRMQLIETLTDNIHNWLAIRVNKIDRRLIVGHYRTTRPTKDDRNGRIVFDSFEFHQDKVELITTPSFDGDDAWHAYIDNNILTDDAAHDAAVAALDARDAERAALVDANKAKAAAAKVKREKAMLARLKAKYEVK